MRQLSLYITCILVSLLLSRTLSAQQRLAQTDPGQAAATQAHTGHHSAKQGSSHAHAAQTGSQPPPIVVKATTDKQQILIGQPIQLMLEVTVQGNTPLNWPPLDSLPHFEWVEKGGVDSVIRPDGRYYRQYLTVTSFDSGTWSIPRLPFVAGDKGYFSDSVRIKVDYTKFDPSKDYHDIKGIIDVPNPFAKWIGWIVAGFTLLSLALVIWLVRKRKLLKVFTPAVPVPVLSPYEEAIRQLEELERQGLAENGPAKTYYTRLNDILRLFVLRKLGIASLVETNDELIGQIRQLPLTRDQFSDLSETLHMSDFVKFAKYQPGLSDNEHNLRVIRSSVEALNSLAESGQAADGKQLPAENKQLLTESNQPTAQGKQSTTGNKQP